MKRPGISTPAKKTRPPETTPAAALPLATRDGVATVAITGEHPAITPLTGSLPRTIAALALPSVASMLLMTVFATADAFWVGTRIGAGGLAAVSISLFWIWQVIALGEMVSVGLTAVAARRHGQGAPARAARSVGDGMVLALALGVVVAVAGLFLTQRLVATMQAPADVAALSVQYLGTYLLGSPLIFGFFAVDAAFRASGDTRTPFLILAVSVTAALVLDPILILGFGPLPALGIRGAAAATIFTRAVAFGVGVRILARRGMISLNGFRGENLPAIVRVGLPTAATGIAFSLIYIFLTRITTQFGTPALAALGIGHRVESWAYMIGVGFGAAAAAIVGQNMGAQNPARASRAGWVTMGLATGVGVVAAVLEYVFAIPFASFFTDDPAVIQESALYLRIAAISTAFIGAELVLEGALGGAGATLPPMLASTSLTAIRVPLAAWAAPRYGTAGIWWTLSLTAMARGVAMVLIWRAGRWQHRAL